MYYKKRDWNSKCWKTFRNPSSLVSTTSKQIPFHYLHRHLHHSKVWHPIPAGENAGLPLLHTYLRALKSQYKTISDIFNSPLVWRIFDKEFRSACLRLYRLSSRLFCWCVHITSRKPTQITITYLIFPWEFKKF